MIDKAKIFIKQIEEVLKDYKNHSLALKSDLTLSSEAITLANSINTRIVAIIARITGTNSEYYKQTNDIITNTSIMYPVSRLERLAGVVSGLSSDLKSGNLRSLSELIHADIFSDYIEMAEYLLNEKYKDPAAVIVGSTLEEHLRKLCIKNGIDIERMSHEKLVPRKADAMNSDLARERIYSKLEQKNITAWLDLRNKAAHGKYDQYHENQVIQMIMGVRDFILRFPA